MRSFRGNKNGKIKINKSRKMNFKICDIINKLLDDLVCVWNVLWNILLIRNNVFNFYVGCKIKL